MNIQELQNKANELAKAAEDVLTHAKSENRDYLNADEDKKFDALHDERDRVLGTIARIQKQDAAMKGEGRQVPPGQPTADPGQSFKYTGKVSDYDRQEAFRAWALAGTDAPITDAQRETARRCGLDLNAKRLSLNMFAPTSLRAANLKNPSAEEIRAWRDETRAALTGAQSTTTTGGYTVADAAMGALEVALLAFGGVRQVATVIRTATGGPLPIPTTNDTSNKGEIISENVTSNELEMTFGQLVLDSYKYSSKYILASIEFLQDSSINVADFIGSALGNRIGRIQNDHFTTGSGSQPNGVVTAATSGVTSVADPPTYDNFVDLVHSIDPAYRNNGRFMMNDTTLKTIKKIKVLQYSGDTSGVPLWAPSMTNGQPDTILGYPYVINQSMASPGSTAKKVLFGDFSKYIIRDVMGIELRRLDERYAELGQVAFLAFARSDGDLLNAGTNPVKYMQQA